MLRIIKWNILYLLSLGLISAKVKYSDGLEITLTSWTTALTTLFKRPDKTYRVGYRDAKRKFHKKVTTADFWKEVLVESPQYVKDTEAAISSARKQSTDLENGDA